MTLPTVLLALASSTAQPADKYWVYYGTYTAPGKSEGIYRSSFDPATGELGPAELAAKAASPSFLAVHPSKKFLYAVGEGSPGGVHAFTLDDKTGGLSKINSGTSGGPGPCHLTVDPSGKCVVVANYGGGSVACLPIGPDGGVGKPGTFIQHAGKSVNKSRQGEPHAHSANFSPDGQFAIVADLGLDKLIVYKLKADAARLTSNDPEAYKVPAGAGPRHFAFHPNGKYAYTNGEMDFNVYALSYDAAKGAFAPINHANTLPKDTPTDVVKKNSTAEVVVHPSGKWVLASNRGHNSVAVFKVDDATGGITPAGHLTGGINIPRNFAVDPTGKWVLVANQDGDSVSVFSWDNESGSGKPTGTVVKVGKPVCIKFVAVGK